MKVKIEWFSVRPSLEKRKIFHVYCHTDISLVVDLCSLRLDQL